MSGITNGKTLTIFGTAPKHILQIDEKTKLIVKLNECFLTKTLFIEYMFHEEKDFIDFIKKSGWDKLPIVHRCGTRVFTDYIDGKFIY
jgi:hypothetical protein